MMGVYIKGVTVEELMKVLICSTEFMPDGFEIVQTHNVGDMVSRSYLLSEYDRQHEGPPGGARKIIEEAPSAWPERLTDDDFETIRIHLNAFKEKLCNQHRWKEANEYQRIIDRFMAFASAEPDVPDIHVGNMISQQDAIKAVARAIWHYPKPSLLNNWHFSYELAEDALKRLPSAEPEIIRCKDCMYYSRPRVNYCAWCSECRMAVNEDDYCSRAERRTDG